MEAAMLRLATLDDAPAIREIYGCYIDTSITFEEELPSVEAYRVRMASVMERYPFLVAERGGRLIGYAYAHEQAERAAYRWNVELSVYLAPRSGRNGLGTTLYRALLQLLRVQGYRWAYARVTMPNAASKRLHAKLGFKLEWTQKRAGWKAGRWHDVAWFAKQLAPQNERPARADAQVKGEKKSEPTLLEPGATGAEAALADAPQPSSTPAEPLPLDLVDPAVVVDVLAEANKTLARNAKKPVVSATTRKCMQGNKGANTKPEQVVRQMLREMGAPGYRLQWKKCPGRPDIAYPGRKLAIFVNGCFWHRCPVCNLPMPGSNVEYWEAKFKRNVERDRENREALEAAGWTVLTIWEHDLTPERRADTSRYLYEYVKLPE